MNGTEPIQQIASELDHILPPELRQKSELLANLIRNLSEDVISREQVQLLVQKDVLLQQAIQSLHGKSISTAHSQVSFGSNNQFGDINIKDVIQGNKIIAFNYFASDNKITPDRRLRSEKTLLDRVKYIWLTNYLERSTPQDQKASLTLADYPNAVELTFQTQYQELDLLLQPRFSTDSIIKLFDDRARCLLILGAPGSGKTTLLLELLRELAKRAEQDVIEGIPVVLNLSSWAEKRMKLEDWIVKEISLHYRVPKREGRKLLKNERLIFLLDGLDEVKMSYRATCVEAINAFHAENLNAQMAVCSRKIDYEMISRKLQLSGAVLITPLSTSQVRDILENWTFAKIPSEAPSRTRVLDARGQVYGFLMRSPGSMPSP
jgi:predicted NACHT family NTPase